MPLGNAFFPSSSIPSLPAFGVFPQTFSIGLPNLRNEDSVQIERLEADLESRQSFHFPSKGWCATSLIGGMAISIMSHNPLPFVLGCIKCLPGTYAQQKIGSEFHVNTITPYNQINPAVTGLRNGNFVVTWQGYVQNWREVFAQLFAENGSKIGTEFQVNAFANGDQKNPAISSLDDGNFVVVWENGFAMGTQVVGQLFSIDANKIGTQFQVDSSNASFSPPSVTSLKDGNFVVAWTGTADRISSEVFGQLFAKNASKIGTEFQVNTYTDWNQHEPSVTSLKDSNFVIVWLSAFQSGALEGIYGQLFSANGNKIGSEFQVNTVWTSRDFSVKGLNNGNFVVTWTNEQDDGIFGQLFAGNGSKIGNEFQVDTFANILQDAPSIASFNNSNFVVIWEDWDGGSIGDKGIFGQLFSGDASKIGTKFHVNTYTDFDQYDPCVTSLKDGNFAVIWTCSSQEGNDLDGIFGQLFSVSDMTSSSAITSTTSSSVTTRISYAASTNPSTGSIASTASSIMSKTGTTSSSSTLAPLKTNTMTSVSSTSLPPTHVLSSSPKSCRSMF